jgi:hypothetical protein
VDDDDVRQVLGAGPPSGAFHLSELGEFARRLGRETNQGEVGLIVGDRYHPIVDY